MYKAYSLIVDNVIKIVWLTLMLHWLTDGTKVGDIFK